MPGSTSAAASPELRRVLEAEGIEDPLWYEVPKAKKAPARSQRALEEGAELVFAWGGDGMVRRCVGVIAGGEASLAVLPAGTSNLFATNLGIPNDIEAGGARSGCAATHARLDVGRFKRERFAVMAGAGFDAGMIRDADDLKERLGRAAYVWSGARNLRTEAFAAEIEVDGASGTTARRRASCSATSARCSAVSRSSPTPGPMTGSSSSASSTARGLVKWARTLARTAAGDPRFAVRAATTRRNAMKVRLDRKVRYELDGGERTKVKSFKVAGRAGRAARPRPATADGGG